MGTAANMNYVAIARECDDDVSVTAAVTAGVEGNATSAGEPATWRETDAGMQKVPVYAGTINTMLLINRPLTPAALARVVVTMTEGKTAALQRLAVPSKLHIDLATGTGTDRSCVAAPASGSKALTTASPAHEARGDHRVGDEKRDARGAALAERPRGELHARRLPRARSIRRARGHAVRRHRALLERSATWSSSRRTARPPSTSRSSVRRRTRWPSSRIACATARCRRRLPTMRWRSRPHCSQRILPRRRTAGPSSARACGRMRQAT